MIDADQHSRSLHLAIVQPLPGRVSRLVHDLLSRAKKGVEGIACYGNDTLRLYCFLVTINSYKLIFQKDIRK